LAKFACNIFRRGRSQCLRVHKSNAMMLSSSPSWVCSLDIQLHVFPDATWEPDDYFYSGVSELEVSFMRLQLSTRLSFCQIPFAVLMDGGSGLTKMGFSSIYPTLDREQQFRTSNDSCRQQRTISRCPIMCGWSVSPRHVALHNRCRCKPSK